MKMTNENEITDIEKSALKLNALNMARHYAQYENAKIYLYTIRRLLELSNIELKEEERKILI